MGDMLKTKTGTIITLTYNNEVAGRSTNDTGPLVKLIESKVEDKEGLKIYISTNHGKFNRVHHHILINREIDIDIENEWENGHTNIEYIEGDDHYRRVIKYITC